MVVQGNQPVSRITTAIALVCFTIQLQPARSLPATEEGMFTISAPNASLRNSIQRTLSTFERRFMEKTGFPAQDYPPVIVVIHGENDEGRNPPQIRVDAIEGGGPRIQVDLAGGDISENVPRRAIATAMLLREYFSGNALQPGSRIREFPAWLTHGLGLLCSVSKVGEVPALSLAPGKTSQSIEDFLVQKAPPDESISILDNYDTKASSLLEAGLQGEGTKAFRDWLGRYSNSISSKKLPPWPPGWDLRAVERKWLLIMAVNSGAEDPMLAQFSTCKSLQLYDEIMKPLLKTRISGSEKLSSIKGWDLTAREMSSRLVALRLKSNPLVLPLIDSSIVLLKDAKHLTSKKLDQRLLDLSQLRKLLTERSLGIESYLDWYEASKLNVRSRQFDALLISPEIRSGMGPIGKYLDAVEVRGW